MEKTGMGGWEITPTGVAGGATGGSIRLGCLDKGVDLELILGLGQISRLEELDGPRAQQIREWLKGQ
jgi:hypothetical protein